MCLAGGRRHLYVMSRFFLFLCRIPFSFFFWATFGSTASTQSDCAYGQRDVCGKEAKRVNGSNKKKKIKRKKSEAKQAAKWQRQRLIGLAAGPEAGGSYGSLQTEWEGIRVRERESQRGVKWELDLGNRHSCAFP